jgi:integrase
MSRRNQGPKLRWLAKRGCYYISWTDQGRTRKRSTGTASREEAEIIFGEWLQTRGRRAGPRDPSQMLVTDMLTDYATGRGLKVASRRVIGYAIEALTPFWQDYTGAEITPEACEAYAERRGRSENTVRRELNVLATAAGYAFKNGRISRKINVELPPKPRGKMRWLTRKEVALLILAALRSDKARPYLPLFILIAVYTGRRKEAILSLRWFQLDLDRGLIDFEGGVKR